MNRYYEARAPWHDHFMSYTSNAAMERLLAPIIAEIEPAIVNRSVLEIACGTGNWTQVLAKRAASVTAMDASPRALDIARDKNADFKNISFKQGDAYDPGCVDGAFEVVFAADWWSHIPRAMFPSFLGTIVQRTRVGSVAIFLDMSINDHFRQETCRYDADGNRISLRELPDGSNCEVVKNFPDRAELERILKPVASDIDYYEFESLLRWMVVFQLRAQT